MHDMVFALSFVGMVIAPVLVATRSGRKPSEPDDVVPEMVEPKIAAPVAAPIALQRKRKVPRAARVDYGVLPTLPLHGTRSLAGR